MTQNDDFDSWFAGGEHKETIAYISHCLFQLKIVHMMQKLENQMLFCKIKESESVQCFAWEQTNL